MKKLTRERILEVNRMGMQNPNAMWFFYTPSLQVAFDLGQDGVDLSQQPDVSGFRYGNIPDSGLSHNYMDDRSERGLSLAALDGQKEVGSSIWFCGRKEVKTSGLLLPRKGSDGEPLILSYDVEDFD